MNTKALECFLAAAEEMNFSRAAERLYLSQQSLSYQIQRLEEEYNVQLFERVPTLRLTLAGKDMIFYAKQILDFESQMKANFTSISSLCRGQIRFGIARLRSTTMFPPTYEEFRQKWSNIDFKLVDGSSEKFAQMLENQDLDLYTGFRPIERHPFQSTAVGTEQLICCMSQRFLEENTDRLFPNGHRDFIELQELCQFPLCMLPNNSILRTKIDQSFIHYHLKPTIALESAGQDTVLQICSASPIIGIITNAAFSYYVRSNKSIYHDLVAFPIRDSLAIFPLYLVYRKDAAMPEYLQEYISIADRHFREFFEVGQRFFHQSASMPMSLR